MNRIDKKFSELKSKKANGSKALVTFVTAGDPDISATKKLVFEMEKNGADIIELGIPFSDPIAEGPVIQEANIRALSVGINLNAVFGLVAEIRETVEIPFIFLMYFNSLLSYGIEKFFKACFESGVDGVIIPDLPFEESGEIAEYAGKYNVEQITLIAPTSSGERIEKMAKTAKGFLYCVSSMGVTGMRREFDTDFGAFFDKVNKYTNLPKCIGFGVSDADAARSLRNYCDGVIVGSAIVRLVGDKTLPLDKRIENVGNFTRELKAALTV